MSARTIEIWRDSRREGTCRQRASNGAEGGKREQAGGPPRA